MWEYLRAKKNPNTPTPHRDLPQGIEEEEGKVEVAFVGVVFECEENGVEEPQPANQAHRNEAIAWRTFVEIQHQPFVKKLKKMETYADVALSECSPIPSTGHLHYTATAVCSMVFQDQLEYFRL